MGRITHTPTPTPSKKGKSLKLLPATSLYQLWEIVSSRAKNTVNYCLANYQHTVLPKFVTLCAFACFCIRDRQVLGTYYARGIPLACPSADLVRSSHFTQQRAVAALRRLCICWDGGGLNLSQCACFSPKTSRRIWCDKAYFGACC